MQYRPQPMMQRAGLPPQTAGAVQYLSTPSLPPQTTGTYGSSGAYTSMKPIQTQQISSLSAPSTSTFQTQQLSSVSPPSVPAFASPQYSLSTPTMGLPMTPKIQTTMKDVGPVTITSMPAMSMPKIVPASLAQIPKTRQEELEQQVRMLEELLVMKDRKIKELTNDIMAVRPNSSVLKVNGSSKARSPSRKTGGFRTVSGGKPAQYYQPVDQDDPIDVRLAEFYNTTGSAISFKRINRGFYRFGDTIVELDIVNHKLMARTEDGWNRGKLGPIEKFMMYYENVEREKLGILPEN